MQWWISSLLLSRGLYCWRTWCAFSKPCINMINKHEDGRGQRWGEMAWLSSHDFCSSSRWGKARCYWPGPGLLYPGMTVKGTVWLCDEVQCRLHSLFAAFTRKILGAGGLFETWRLWKMEGTEWLEIPRWAFSWRYYLHCFSLLRIMHAHTWYRSGHCSWSNMLVQYLEKIS